MQEIPLTQGYVALVDDEDYPRLAQHKWYANVACGRVYAYRDFRMGRRKFKVAMHREIMEAFPGEEIDHRIGTGLDNRRHNLRRATRSEQRANQGPRKDSRYGRKGVKRHQGRWFVRITCDGKTHNLGSRDDIDEAAELYAEKARELFGEFARTA